MKKIFFSVITVITVITAITPSEAQIVKTAGICYTNGAPAFTPSSTGCEYAVDTVTMRLYWRNRNGSTWSAYPRGVDVISGSIPPAYTPRDNQSTLAINADNELYYHTGAAWVQIGGSGGGGIYGGSGTTGAPFTAVTVDSIIRFNAPDATGRFIANVSAGSDVAGLLIADTLSQITYDDAGGTNLVEVNNEGVSITTLTSDRVTITGKDARYAADYSGTYSARSIVDKGYVDGAVTAGISIPDTEIALGNSGGDGLTSYPGLAYDGSFLAVEGDIDVTGNNAAVVVDDVAASSPSQGGTLYLNSKDGAALASGDRVGGISFIGTTGVSGTSSGATIDVFAAAGWSGTSSPGNIKISTTPSASLTPIERMRITRAGEVQLRNGATLDFHNSSDAAVMQAQAVDSTLYIYGLGDPSEAEFAFQGKIGLSTSGSVGLTGNANNLYLGSGGGVVEVGSTGAYNITGMQANIVGNSSRMLFAINGSNYTLTLVDESASSSAANRFSLGGSNYSWASGATLLLLYDNQSDRWVLPNQPTTSALSSETNAPPTIYPAQITATQNDYSPTGYSTTVTQTIQVDGDASFRTITGMAAATRNGVEKTLDNDGTNCYIVAKQHTGSSAANRFEIPKDVIMYPGMQATFRYDSVGARWRLKHTNEASIYYGNKVETTLNNNTGTVTDNDNPSYAFTTNGGSWSPNNTAATSTPKRRSIASTASAATAFPLISARNGNGTMFLATDGTYIRIFAKIRTDATLSTNAESYEYRMGFEAGAPDTVLSQGAVINYHHTENSGGWTVKTTNAAVSTTTTNAGAAITTATFYNLELVFYPYGEVAAWINGTRYATTSTLPSSQSVVPFFMVDKDNGTTARTIELVSFDTNFTWVNEQ